MINSIHTAEHYKWGNNCDGWHLLKSESLSMIQELMPPDTFETLHYHVKAQQIFYILSGTANFQLQDTVYTLNAGDSIHVKSGIPHMIMNKGVGLLSFLVVSEPMAHGDKVIVNI